MRRRIRGGLLVLMVDKLLTQSKDYMIILHVLFSDKMFYQVITEGLMVVSDGVSMAVVLHDTEDREKLCDVMQGSEAPLSVISLLGVAMGPRWAAESKGTGGRILLDLRQVWFLPMSDGYRVLICGSSP